MSKNPELIAFGDSIGRSLFGMSISDAKDAGICIQCKSPIRVEPGEQTGESGQIYSQAGMNEYQMTALCETCFDCIFDDTISAGEHDSTPPQEF